MPFLFCTLFKIQTDLILLYVSDCISLTNNDVLVCYFYTFLFPHLKRCNGEVELGSKALDDVLYRAQLELFPEALLVGASVYSFSFPLCLFSEICMSMRETPIQMHMLLAFVLIHAPCCILRPVGLCVSATVSTV